MLQFSKVFSIKLSSRNTNNGAAASFLAAAPYVLNGFRYCPYLIGHASEIFAAPPLAG